jgi:4-amino-4-deoxy-L-arabinose transferase-like glycosyltransferase
VVVTTRIRQLTVQYRALATNNLFMRPRSAAPFSFSTGCICYNVDKNMLEKLKNDKYFMAVLALIAVHLLFFVIFQNLHQAYQTWDSAGHIGMSMYFADQFASFAEGGTGLFDIIRASNYYPPLVQSLGGVFNLIFGYQSGILLYVAFGFFALSIIYVYKLSLLLSNDQRISLLASFIYSLFPLVVDQARVFHLDIPLNAFLLISIFYLIKSARFTSRKETLLFFVFFGFAQLTKWYAWIFLIVPVVYLLITGLREVELDPHKNQAFKKNLLIGAVIFSFLTLPWYILNYTDLLDFARIFAQGETDDPTVFLSLSNLFYYPWRIMIFQILFVPTFFVFLGLRKVFQQNRRHGVLFLVFILLPIVVFTLISNKNLRYILPLSPLFAYLISYFIINSGRFVKNFTYLIVGYMLFSFAFLSFNQFTPETLFLKYVGAVLAGPGYNDYYHNPGVYAYEKDYWPVKEVLEFIVEDANYPNDRGLGITPLIDSENFSLASVEMLRRELRLSNVYVPVPYFQFSPFSSGVEIVNYLNENSIQYLIVPQEPGPTGLRNYDVLKQMIFFLTSDENRLFDPVKRFELPNGDAVVVYRRNRDLEETTLLEDNTCVDNAGFADGVESIKLEPEKTYVFFTGHFAVEDIKVDFEEGVLNILQVENTVHESVLDVHALPHTGSSMCKRPGLGLDVIEEIKKPLLEKGHCGIDCKKVRHVKWSVGDQDFEQKDYNRGDF